MEMTYLNKGEIAAGETAGHTRNRITLRSEGRRAIRKKIITAAVAGLLIAPGLAQAETEINWFGFSQITAQAGGYPDTDDGLQFGADRVRIGYKGKHGAGVHSKLQLDFNQSSDDSGGLPAVIKDAVVGYKIGNWDIQTGMRKTLVGLDFNTSGMKLDWAKRGLEKSLVGERALGVFVFGDMGPLGIAFSAGNAFGRSSAVNDAAGQFGEDADDTLGYSGRLSYSMGKMFYGEVSAGLSEGDLSDDYDGPSDLNGNGYDNDEDYTVIGVGFKSNPVDGLTFKGEYLDADGVLNEEDRTQNTWYLHGGYEITPNIEGIVRYYSAEHETSEGDETDLTNTIVGVNYFFVPEKHHIARLQLNYLFAGGDTLDSSTPYGGAGTKGFMGDDTFLAQFQAAF